MSNVRRRNSVQPATARHSPHMKSLFVLLTFLLLGSQVLAQQRLPVQADPAFTERLTEFERANDLGSLFRAANEAGTREQLKSALDWMQRRAVGPSRDPRFLLSYAALLYRAQIREMSAASYLFGILLARVEAARCADSSAYEPKLRQIEAEMRPVEEMYWKFAPEQRHDFLAYALQSERQRPSGSPIAWLCSGGNRDTIEALREGSARVIPAPNETASRVTVIDSSAVSPSFLPDEQSAPARRAAIANFQSTYGGQSPSTLPGTGSKQP